MNVIPNIGLIPFLPDPQTGWVSIPPILGQLECNTTAKAILTWFRQTNWNGPVKVLIPQSNAFGHKISSINVAKRLAELRLMNQVILIPEQPQIEQQVVRLLTTIHKDLAWGKSVSSNDVTITAMPCASLGSLPRKGIGFTGGFESSIGSLKATLKVEHAIMLQPPAWKSSCCLSIPKVPRLLAIGRVPFLWASRGMT
jgi:hypothetical protein